MANETITDLDAIDEFQDDDVLAADDASDSSITKKGTPLQMTTYLGKKNLSSTFSTSGLNFTASAFSVVDSTGVAVDISEQTLAIQASSTQYAVIDMSTKSLKFLDRAYHDGAITLAKVTADGSSITDVKRVWAGEKPKTKIPKFLTRLAKAREAGDIRIGIIGDSLMKPAGSGVRWDDLLFDSTYVANGYNVTNADYITVDNFSVSGSTSHCGMIYAGEGSFSNDGNFENTQTVYTATESTRRFFPPKTYVQRSPFFTRPYDLILVGYGANGGTADLLYLENQIRQFKKTGAEIVVVTQNYRTDNASFLKSRGDDLKIICNNYGCGLADTWMYVLEEERSGSTVHFDVIHMAQAGHNAYAEALKGILDPTFELAPDVMTPPYRRVIGDTQNTAAEWNIAASSAHIQFEPHSTTGTTNQATSVTDTNKNPAIIFGGKTSSNAVTSLAAGQVAKYGHPYANSCDIIVDGQSTFTGEINRNNGANQLSTIELTTALSGRIVVIEGVQPATYADVAGSFRANRGIQVECLTGTLDILGVIFHVDPVTQLDIDNDISTNGTFATEAWTYSHPHSVYSDTDNDSISFDFYGSEAVVYLSQRSAAGIIDVYVDGKLIYNQEDLYSATDLSKALLIQGSGDSTDYEDRLPSKHSVQIYLNGANASAITPVSSNRRLGLLGIDVIERG